MKKIKLELTTEEARLVYHSFLYKGFYKQPFASITMWEKLQLKDKLTVAFRETFNK